MRQYIEDRSIPEPNSGCWLWLLSTGSHGYGQGSPGKSKVTTAHRISYEAYKGPIPKGYEVDHLCRNKLCVNPEHLEAVTPIENELRMCADRGWAAHRNPSTRKEQMRERRNEWQRNYRNRASTKRGRLARHAGHEGASP